VAKHPGRGLLVYRESSLIGQLLSVDPVGSSRRVRNTTRFGDEQTSYALGMHDGNELALLIASDPAEPSRSALYDDFATRALVNFDFVHEAGGQIISFPALVIGVREASPLDGLFTFQARLKITAPGLDFRGVRARKVSLTAVAEIDSHGQTSILLRSASLNAVATIAVSGRKVFIFERAASLDAVGTISVAGTGGAPAGYRAGYEGRY
jgi:hypothetical protein